jgi:transcriptional regulator with XRE-family HTH domain
MAGKNDPDPVVAGIRWILANRTGPGGKRFSMRKLSELAGLTPGHVEQIVSGRQSSKLEAPTATGIARAGNVRVNWLLTGHGPREPFDEREGAYRTVQQPTVGGVVDYDDAYPSRVVVLAMARAKGIDGAAIAALEAERFKGEDPGEAYWRKRLVELVTESRLLDQELKRAAQSDDDTFGTPNPPPGGPRGPARR